MALVLVSVTLGTVTAIATPANAVSSGSQPVPAAGATGSVTGLIVSKLDLEPVLGAVVSLTRDSCGQTTQFGEEVTEEDGTYTFLDVPMDRTCSGVDVYRLDVVVPDQPRLAPSTTIVPLAGGTTREDVLVRAYAMVSGTVTSTTTGEPLAGIAVVVDDSEETFESTSTDSEGRYTLFFTGERKVFVRVYSPERTYYGKFSGELYFEDSEARVLDYALDNAMVIEGVVTDDAEPPQPVPGVRVDARFGGDTNVTTVTTDASGRYSIIAGYAPGQTSALTLTAPQERWVPVTSPVFTTVPNTRQTFDVQLQQGASVSGIVTRADGDASPLSDVQVYAYSADASRIWLGQAVTDADGEYTISNLPPRPVLLSFSGKGGFGYPDQWWRDAVAASAATPIELEPGDVLDGYDAALERGATVVGTVTLDDTGAPTRYAVVTLTRTDGAASYTARTEQDGRYRIENVFRGEYTMSFAPVEAGSRYRPVYSGGTADPARAEAFELLPAQQDTQNAALQRIRPPSETSRVGGADRYVAAVNVSKAAYAEGADVVFVVSGQNYSDALSAGPAAVAASAPLLLTPPDRVLATVRAEMDRLDPRRIVIVGGPASVSRDVEEALAGIAEVERISGSDRYAVSRAVARMTIADTGAEIAYIATGTNFPDALSAGAAAGAQKAPVILVNGRAGDVPDATEALLRDLGIDEIIVAGGPASVSPEIAAALQALAPVTRLGGADRFAASAAISADAFGYAEQAFLVTGLRFPDALSGAAWAGAENAPLYVSRGDCVPRIVLDAMTAQGVQRVTLIGGTASLATEVAALERC
jgi:putative cell wall-binding protein/5-hydroxyisourate hydrolase-like protein (transthyretin family)